MENADPESLYRCRRIYNSPEAEIDPETGFWGVYYRGPVVECPFCEQGVGVRIHRQRWMKFIPLLMHMQCRTCYKTFFKLSKG